MTAVLEDPERLLVLFHFTDPEAAHAIVNDRAWHSRENTQEVYASNREDGQAMGYGDAIVHVVVYARAAQLDDEFPDGERHYRFDPRDALVIGITT